MFNKGSRYIKLKDVTVTDASGRTLQAKSVRARPDTEDTFPYSVTETDRLDHLGYRAFQKSDRWWRICDANAGYLHPQDLIGRSSTRQCMIKLTPDDNRTLPNWNMLLRAVRAMTGVEEAAIEEAVDLQPDSTVSDEERKIYLEQHYSAGLRIIFNSITTDEIRLFEQIEMVLGNGITADRPEMISRTGKEIAIPSGRTKGG